MLGRERHALENRPSDEKRREEELSVVIPPLEQIVISPEKATELWAAGAYVLDVREPFETARGIVPAANLIPLGQIPERFAEIPGDREVVIYCAAGRRSLDAACFLYTKGFKVVYSVDGGISRWRPS